MITFILGSGHKRLTDEIFKRAANCKKEAGALIILPEQYSFEGEGELALNYSLEIRQNIEITTISKLVRELCKNLYERPALTSAAAEVLLRRIIIENEDKLRFFKGKNAKFAFVSKLIAVNNEFINGGVSLETIENISEGEQNGSLCDKLHDLSILLKIYREECEKRFYDINEDIKTVSTSDNAIDYLKGRDIYFHGYSGFKEPQSELIKSLILNGCDISFSFLADNLDDESFLIIRDVIHSIERQAKDFGAVAETIFINEDEKSPLSKFATALFKNSDEAIEGDSVRVIPSDNRYDEIAQIAAIIKNEIFQGGARYSDFLLIARDIGEYENPISELFGRAEIPYYADKKTSLITSSPAAVCLFALRYCIFGGAVSDAIDFAKTALLKIDDNDFKDFLSYLEIFNIKGRQLKKSFTATHAKIELIKVEEVRKKIITPLTQFKKDFSKENKTKAIWKLLQRVDYQQNLKEYSKNKDSYYIRELRRQYDELIGAVDEIYAATENTDLSNKEYYELITRVLTAHEYGSVERMIDEVLITNLSTIPRTEKKTVFIIGANEGVYPLAVKENSVFSSFERRLLGKEGISVLDNALYNYRFDIYNIYSALKLATEKLYISYPKQTLLGEELLVSSFVIRACSVMANSDIIVPQEDAEYYINSKGDLREIIATGEATLSNNKVLEELFSDKPFDFSISKDIIGDAIDKELYVYPTTIEQYANCPFSYLCRYVLSARALMTEELSLPSAGRIIHYCLEQLLSRFDEKALLSLDERDIYSFIDEMIDRYLKREFSEFVFGEKRFKSNIRRIRKSLFKVISYLIDEYRESSFRVAELEISIGDGETKPYIIDIGDGYKLSLRGYVDRVDCYKSENGDFLRVIDYKSGDKVFKLSDLKNGINLQLFIYLFALIKDGKYKDFIPAGALYQPSFADVQSKVLNEEDIKTIKKSLTKDGLLLSDETSLVGMERNREGIFIPVTAKDLSKSKTPKSLATLEEIGKVERIITESIGDMGKKIVRGEFPPLPLSSKSKINCTYCEYNAVCKRRDDEEVREYIEYDREEFYDGY